MAKVQFQVDGLDSNTASIFNDDVTFDGNVDAASISVGGTDILGLIGGSLSVEVSSNITLSANTKYFVDTSSARTLTLPASPIIGDEIYIFDATGTAETYNITVDRNGKLINGNEGNLIFNVDGASVALIYTGLSYGWRVG